MTKNKTREDETDGEALSESISLSYLIVGSKTLETLSDARSFDEFLKRNSIRKRPLLPGMKLIFQNIIDNVINQISIGTGFQLSSDRITRRALSRGIAIENVKSNSPIAKLLRGLKRTKEEVCKETSVPDFHITLSEQLSALFQEVNVLFDKHTTVFQEESKDLDKEVVLNLFSFSWYLRFLNIHQQVRVPLKKKIIEKYDDILGGFESELESEPDPKFLERMQKQEKENEKERKKYEQKFIGWKTCTAYLWSKLVDSNLPDAPVDSVLGCNSWEELDDLFRPTADDLIAGVDERLGTQIGSVFSLVSAYKINTLNSLMLEYDEILAKDEKFILDHVFLWYDFEILDGAHPKIFPGVATFTNLLIGSVYMRNRYGWKDPIEIRRIMHPAGYHTYLKNGERINREKFDVSYAILVQSFSTMADYSGWMVSLDCCNDYSGFGGGMREFAEYFIEQNRSDLSIEDVTISLVDFKQYLKTRLQERYETPFGGRLSISEWERMTLDESIELGIELSAVIIELFIAVSMAESKYDVHWQYRNKDVLGDKEIDVLAVNENEVQIIECSRHFPKNAEGVLDIVEEMKRKLKLIQNSEFQRKRTILRYITSKNIDSEEFKDASELFRKEGIHIENLYQLLGQSQHRTKTLQNILSEAMFLRTRVKKML